MNIPDKEWGGQMYGKDLVNQVKIWDFTLERFMLHDHQNFEITLIVSGSIHHMCNGVTTVLEEGYITFLSPNCIHQYYSSGESAKIINLTFNPGFVSDDVWKYMDMAKMPLIIKLEGNDLISVRDTLDSIHALSEEYMKPLKESVYLKTLVEWLVLKLSKLNGSSVMKEDSLSPAVIYIHSNFTHDITEKEVAEYIHYSPSYFSMLFKKQFGIPFKTYVLNQRLDYAAGLLESTDFTISEICEKSGFVTQVYFSRAFKKRFGIPPGEHRKKLRNSKESSYEKI